MVVGYHHFWKHPYLLDSIVVVGRWLLAGCPQTGMMPNFHIGSANSVAFLTKTRRENRQ